MLEFVIYGLVVVPLCLLTAYGIAGGFGLTIVVIAFMLTLVLCLES